MKKKQKINDNKLLRLVNEGLTQSQIGKYFGVTPAAVNKRLKVLRGRTTKAVVSAKIEEAVDNRIDSMAQLTRITA